MAANEKSNESMMIVITITTATTITKMVTKIITMKALTMEAGVILTTRAKRITIIVYNYPPKGR